MITMNRKTRAAHRFRGTSAGVVAAVMMFGLADLIARAFTPSAAPLLTLGQAIIPLAPPAAIKPVIALFGDNDKLVLVLSTGLGALVLAGLIGALAVSRRRLATTLLVVAGLVPVIVIIIRPEAGAIDVIPTLIGIAAGVAVFLLLLRFGVPTTHAEATDSPDVARGSRTSESLSRRRFFGLAGAIGAIGAVTIATGQTLVSLTQEAGAAVAKLVLPNPAKKAAAIPAAASTDVDGTVPFVTEAKDFYRIDTVLSPPVIDPEQWSLRIHGMVENEVTLHQSRPPRPASGRTPHHAHLRIQSRRRGSRRQCDLARLSRARTPRPSPPEFASRYGPLPFLRRIHRLDTDRCTDR